MERIFRKSKPSLALPATKSPRIACLLRIRDSHISKNYLLLHKRKKEDGKCTLSRIYIFEFSLLFLQYLDYMSRKTRTVLSRRILFVLGSSSKSDRVLPWYFTTKVNCASLSRKYQVYRCTGIYHVPIHIDDVLVSKLARKNISNLQRTYCFLARSYTVVSKATWQKRITWQIHTIENKSDKTPSIKNVSHSWRIYI